MSGPADNTARCPTCQMMPHVHGCTPGKRGAPAPPAVDHPTPWCWAPFSRLDPGLPIALYDANGAKLVEAAGLWVNVPSAYVREVTSLAPELERLVGQLCDSIAALSHDERGDYIHRPETDEAGRRQSYARGVLARLDAARKLDGQ